MKLNYRPGSIFRSSIQTMGVYGLRLIVQLTLLFMVARYLGPEQFGEYAGIVALAVGLGTLSSFGLGFVVLGESSKSSSRGQVMLAQAVSATLISAVLLGLIYFWLCHAVLGTNANNLVLALISFSELLLVPWIGLLSYRMQGLGQIARSQIIAILPMALRLMGLAVCIALLPVAGLELYAAVHAGGAIAGLLLSLRLLRGEAVGFLRPLKPEFNSLRQGMGYAVMNFMAVNPGELDKALALRLLGPGETGLYTLASRGMAVVTLPVVAMLLSSQPQIFRQADSEQQSSYRLIAILLLLSFGYGLIAMSLLYFVAPALLRLGLGLQYEDIGEVIAAIAFIAPFMCLRFTTGGILLALGRPIWRAGIESAALLVLIGLALALSPIYGIQGLIWAVFGSELVMSIMGCTALLLHRRARNQLAA